MSHSTQITLITDQEIRLMGEVVNIHDIDSITLNSHGLPIKYVERTKKLPSEFKIAPIYRTSNYWEAKYFESYAELVKANKGIRRLRHKLNLSQYKKEKGLMHKTLVGTTIMNKGVKS